MMRRLEHPPYEGVLRDLGLFCSEKKKLREIRVYEYLKGGYKEDGGRISSVIPSDRTRGKGHRLIHRRTAGITVKVTVHCHGLPKEFLDFVTWNMFKRHL